MIEPVKDKFDTYPNPMKQKLKKIRSLIFTVADEYALGSVEESLKWGEPSYLVKGGSPIRLDWKAKKPDQYAIYFNCNTKLVDTFREVYGELFSFEANRAIVFSKNSALHQKQLKHCIELAMQYHRIKHLPLLGL